MATCDNIFNTWSDKALLAHQLELSVMAKPKQEKVKTSVYMERELHEALNEAADEDGRTPANLLNYILKTVLPLYREEVRRKQDAIKKVVGPKP